MEQTTDWHHGDKITTGTTWAVCVAADSVEEAQKWLIGLGLLREEALAAPTPVVIER